MIAGDEADASRRGRSLPLPSILSFGARMKEKGVNGFDVSAFQPRD